MSPIHFELLEPAFNASGYNLQVLPNDNKQAVDVGLKYVNNDACYPSLMVVGQIMEAILSGKYDTDKIAVIISQDRRWMPCFQTTSDSSAVLLRRPDTEIFRLYSINLSGLEDNPGFKYDSEADLTRHLWCYIR